MTDLSRIRNFSIIAHIDHGKSTLADRILSLTGAIEARQEKAQFLDRLDLERERGITIKAQAVRLKYKAKDGLEYEFHLIDTPGHVDFHYEVSRSLAACEGALLVVDASQGVEAQTLANVYLAVDQGLEIIPVINKVDLPNADVERVRKEIEDIVGIDASDAIPISAKSGLNIDLVLEAIVQRIAPPKGSVDNPTAALVFDSWFDPYQGAVVQVRLREGTLRKGDAIRFLGTGKQYEITQLGIFDPFPKEVTELHAGQTGTIAASIKSVKEAKVGDTVTTVRNPVSEPLSGFREIQPMVFAGIYPIEAHDYDELRDALEKLQLNDAALIFEQENSKALGFGFRCGFLGLLHMEIVQERLEREFNVELITTAPTVTYEIEMVTGKRVRLSNPSDWPDAGSIKEIYEPIIKATIHTPNEYVGALIGLCQQKRGVQIGLQYVTQDRVLLEYELPLNEIVLDFYDKLKSLSRGYASMDYELAGQRPADLVKMDILVAEEPVDALSVITHKETAYARGREMIESLRSLIPRQQFEVPIQAAIGSRIIARETIKALRKNVTAKCYGGDVSRKRKLLERQKEGKKRMKQVGRVEIPQEAFLSVLKVGEPSDDE